MHEYEASKKIEKRIAFGSRSSSTIFNPDDVFVCSFQSWTIRLRGFIAEQSQPQVGDLSITRDFYDKVFDILDNIVSHRL